MPYGYFIEVTILKQQLCLWWYTYYSLFISHG